MLGSGNGSPSFAGMSQVPTRAPHPPPRYPIQLDDAFVVVLEGWDFRYTSLRYNYVPFKFPSVCRWCLLAMSPLPCPLSSFVCHCLCCFSFCFVSSHLSCPSVSLEIQTQRSRKIIIPLHYIPVSPSRFLFFLLSSYATCLLEFQTPQLGHAPSIVYPC